MKSDLFVYIVSGRYRQPGSVFKILHTRQSEVILEFPRKNSSGFVVEENFRAWAYHKISMFRHLEKIRTLIPVSTLRK